MRTAGNFVYVLPTGERVAAFADKRDLHRFMALTDTVLPMLRVLAGQVQPSLDPARSALARELLALLEGGNDA